LVHICGFRFLGTLAQHVERFDLSSEIEVLGPGFERSRLLFGLFRGTPPKSETTFVNKILILFHKCGLRVSGRASEHHAKTPTTPTSENERRATQKRTMPHTQSPVKATTVTSSGPASPIAHRTPFSCGNPRK